MLVLGRLMQPCKTAAADPALSQMDGDVIAKVHFAGFRQVVSDPKGKCVKEMAALPSSTNLISVTLNRLSAVPYVMVKGGKSAGSETNFAGTLRPLFEDLWQDESYIEARGAGDAVPELMLAVRVGNDRAQVWEKSLSGALSAWTGAAATPIKGAGFSGWELKKQDAPNLIRCFQAGDWIVLGWGTGELKLQPSFLSRIGSQKLTAQASKTAWLDALLDWPSFTRTHPIKLPSLLPQELPKMHLTVEGQTDFVRPVLVAQYPEPLDMKLEPWKIPAATINNPIVSFTAMRGIEGWVKRQKFVQDFHPDYIPNQMVTWSRPGVPFESVVAVPYSDARKFLVGNTNRMMPLVDKYLEAGMIAAQTCWIGDSIHLAKMPLANPYITAFHDPAGDFLETGLFPVTHRKDDQPFPPELLKIIASNPNMVCYDWELGAERTTEWRAMIQLYLVLTFNRFPPSSAPAQEWLEEVHKHLGNCGTEMTLTAPNELTVIRNGSIGLSGLEINFLCNWLDAPGFPFSADYGSARFRLPGKANAPAPKPAAPPQQPPH